MRFPSLKYRTDRRFCYVQFASSSAAHRATELDETSTDDGHKLVVKISDPAKKEARGGAMQEGREIFCKNLDFKVKEKDIRQAFAKFGTIENLAIPQNVDGRRKGYFFVSYSTRVCSLDLIVNSRAKLTFCTGRGDRCTGNERGNAWGTPPPSHAKFFHWC